MMIYRLRLFKGFVGRFFVTSSFKPRTRFCAGIPRIRAVTGINLKSITNAIITIASQARNVVISEISNVKLSKKL